MSATTPETRAQEADELLVSLKARIANLQALIHAATTGQPPVDEDEACAALEKENEGLRAEVAALKTKVQEQNAKNGRQAFLTRDGQVVLGEDLRNPQAPAPQQQKAAKGAAKADKKAEGEAPKKEAKKEKKPAAAPAPAAEDAPVTVARLDMRVGLITEAKLHPDAESLYVEQIDVGEEKPRTIISGLVKHVPLDQMQNRPVIILCNLKPAKMRGITSEGMVMCAANADGQVEIIDPPAGSKPGDRITFEGFPGTPDEQLNPKKKIFETVQPELHTNADRVACYRNVPFTVQGKGVCIAPTMAGAGIR